MLHVLSLCSVALYKQCSLISHSSQATHQSTYPPNHPSKANHERGIVYVSKSTCIQEATKASIQAA